MLGLFALVAAAPSVSAFESVPPGGSVHDEITTEAAAQAGWHVPSADVLAEAVLVPDYKESKVEVDHEKVIVIDATEDYEPSHHCDRLPPASSESSFGSATAYVRLQRDQAMQLARAGDPVRATSALGRALHALQDCHSHSDISQLDPATQSAFQRAFIDDLPGPAGLRITAFMPGTDDPELPAADPYPHGLFAKDSDDSTDDASAMLPDGRTKFQGARDLAIGTSALFLEDFLSDLDENEKAQLFAIRPQEASTTKAIPGVEFVTVLFLLAAFGMTGFGRR